MQPTSRVGGFEVGSPTIEPTDVFCGLASLIVEGRMPKNDRRGYGEGPHVPPPVTKPLSSASRHECSEENNLCKKDENFRKHMLLLWQNNVPVSIEILLCSNCQVSQRKVRSVEFSTIPEPGSILLEQWTVSVQSQSLTNSEESLISSHGLFQAVRSYLHFSQLSAWYSSSRGFKPSNVLYRITIPGEAFASKFSCRPEEHYFPSANVGRMSSVHVSVRSLPRCEEIPRVTCPHNVTSPQLSPILSASSSEVSSPPSTSSPVPSPSSEAAEDSSKLSMAGALEWKDSHDSETDLRKTLVKSRLNNSTSGISGTSNDCQLPRSDSMDSMLGDSLLDPPQSLQKIPPKRYQSPSRCGSPSLEAPDHLLFGSSKNTSNTDSASQHHQKMDSQRLARQDLLRRRDISLYTGLHPRLLHAAGASGVQPQQPRLSLLKTSTPYRAFPCAQQSPAQMPSPASFNPEQPQQQNLGAKKKSLKKPPTPEELSDEDDGVAEDGVLPTEFLYNTSDSRRSSLKDSSDELFPTKQCKKKQNSTLEEILGIQPESGIFSDDSIRVYRAEIPASPALERANHSNVKPEVALEVNHKEVIQPEPQQQPQCKSDILLGAILRTCERNRHLEENSQPRLRSLSENPKSALEPLDLNFDGPTSPKDWSEDEEEEGLEEFLEQEVPDQSSRRSSFSADAHVPTPEDCAHFRQSFDSATSMVFHRRTGLPLTSSPAPLRRGKDKFDFDESITSPHDIKKALFSKKMKKIKQMDEASSASSPSSCDKVVVSLEKAVGLLYHEREEDNKENKNLAIISNTSTNRQRRPSKKLLSASAPATLTSNNLLGNFEESVLNGRLEPNSTVEGFTAEIGASGSFQPKHKTLPVTVFFYTLCDNAAYSSPYLGHINLGKKGYRVPPKGTIQVTLFNPLGTVVKMFVVMYDLSDMPPNSQTFLRQRTLYMPSEGVNDNDLQKWLRYLVHLRFASSNSGKIYLHTDIRMIIFRKSDLDTAADYTSSKGFELRSFTQGPNNPKFSPRR